MLAGVGPAVAAKLQARGLATLQDLWLHLPLRYEDRTRLTRIEDLRNGVPAQVEGRVVAVERGMRSEEHTSELQSQSNLVCRLLLEKKKKKRIDISEEN